MSRNTVYQENGITIVVGVDHALGKFLQLFDKKMEDETPEGEGLVLDWSEFLGVEANYTGISDKETPVEQIVLKYVEEHK
jgi:hypothetical protein